MVYWPEVEVLMDPVKPHAREFADHESSDDRKVDCTIHAGAQATSLELTILVEEGVWSIFSISSSMLSLSIDI